MSRSLALLLPGVCLISLALAGEHVITSREDQQLIAKVRGISAHALGPPLPDRPLEIWLQEQLGERGPYYRWSVRDCDLMPDPRNRKATPLCVALDFGPTSEHPTAPEGVGGRLFFQVGDYGGRRLDTPLFLPQSFLWNACHACTIAPPSDECLAKVDAIAHLEKAVNEMRASSACKEASSALQLRRHEHLAHRLGDQVGREQHVARMKSGSKSRRVPDFIRATMSGAQFLAFCAGTNTSRTALAIRSGGSST